MKKWTFGKRIFAGFLSAALFFSVVPTIPAMAEENPETVCICETAEGIMWEKP